MISEDGIAVVRRNTEEVQGGGNFELFEELFAADFVAQQLGLFQLDQQKEKR